MSAPTAQNPATALQQSLRRAHVSVLVTLAACAAVILLGTEAPAAEAAPGGADAYTYAATALAVLSILTRRRQLARPEGIRNHVILSLVSLVAAAGVGIVGVAASMADTPRNAALVYVVAGVFFALRPPLGLAGDVRASAP